MNAEILSAAGIDYAYGVKRFVGRAQLFEKALTKFTKDDTFSRIRAAYQANDLAGLLACAHEFKGMCGNIGLTRLYDEAALIVTMLRENAFSTAELSAAFEELEKTYETVYAAVISSLEA